MAVKTFNKPYVATAGSARKIEKMLNAPSPLANFTHKPNIMSANDAIRKYGVKK